MNTGRPMGGPPSFAQPRPQAGPFQLGPVRSPMGGGRGPFQTGMMPHPWMPSGGMQPGFAAPWRPPGQPSEHDRFLASIFPRYRGD